MNEWRGWAGLAELPRTAVSDHGYGWQNKTRLCTTERYEG